MSRQKIAFFTSTGLLAAILLLASPMKAADEKNPFALWERLKTQMDVNGPENPEASVKEKVVGAPAATEEKPASEKGKMSYFSAVASEVPARKQSEPAVEVTKERLVVKQPETAVSEVSAEPSQMPEIVSWPNFFEKNKVAPAVSEAPATRIPLRRNSETASRVKPAGSLQTAAFDTTDDTNDNAIRKVSGDFFEDVGVESDDSPFGNLFATETKTDPPPTDAKPNPFHTANASRDVSSVAMPKSSGIAAQLVTHETPVNLPSTLIGPQSPTVTVQWQHHGEFSVGQECRCDLILTNSGVAMVRNVVAEAILPQGLQVVSSEPAPTTTGTSATWTFGELQPGERRKVELVVVPTVQGDHQMNAFVRMTGGSAASFSVTEPEVSVQVEGPESVEVGQVAHYTVNVGNPGTGKARNVAIQAVIPEGLEHRHGSRLTIEIGTLSPGEVRRARLTVTGIKGGAQQLAVRAVGDGDLLDDTIQLVSVAEPKLNIGLRGPQTATTGQTNEYELVVINEGNVDSSNVRAKYRVPAGYEFVSAEAGGKFNEAESTIDWFVGTLDPGQARHFKVTLRATESGAGTHQAGVMSELGGVTVAEHQTDVQGSAKLELNVVAVQQQVTTGEDSIYQIKITNSGASTAENVGVSCELPSGLELVDISGPAEFIEDSGAVIFRKMPTLDPGKTIAIAMKTRCTRAGTHQLRVRVASESIGDALIREAATVGVDR